MGNYLFISDAAKEVRVESHVLRYWEEELHLAIRRNELGHRYYTKEDVERFKVIKGMKERGLQLKAIKMILKDGKLDLLPGQPEKAAEAAQDAGVGTVPGMDVPQGVESEPGVSVVPRRVEPEPGAGVPRGVKPETSVSIAPGADAAQRMETMPGVSIIPGAGVPREVIGDQGVKTAQGVDAAQMEHSLPGGLSTDLVQTGGEMLAAESREEKSKRLQWLLQQLIRETLQENNEELSREIRESVVKELDYQFRMQEEREERRDKLMQERDEEHYKRMDELLRKKAKKKFGLGRKKEKGAS